MLDEHIRQVRAFNRRVTQRVGVLEDSYLSRGRPIGEARLIAEIGAAGDDGVELRTVRERLGLDSGYLSRLLRSLERQGLAGTRPAADGRVRRAVLTEAGQAERGVYDRLSDSLAASLLSPLSAEEQDRLVGAMAQVERLLKAASIEIRPEPPDSQAARHCLSGYFGELAGRFDGGFDPARSISASAAELTPPAGVLLVAWLDGAPAGCAALKFGPDGVGEVKRMWTAPEARGLGIARRLLAALEARASDAGLTRLHLETNRALTEAQALYRRAGYQEVAAFNDEPYAHHWFEKRLGGPEG